MTSELKNAESNFRRAVLNHFEAAAHNYGASVDRKRVVVALAPSGTTLATVPTDNGSHLAYVHRRTGQSRSQLKPGLYEIVVVDSGPALYYQGPEGGKTLVDFEPPETDPIRLSTPLGDWMCEKAPDLIKEYCQSFVACAAYDLFCGQGS